MNPVDDFGELQRQWRQQTPSGIDVDDLRQLVDADTRRHVWTFVGVGALNLAVLLYTFARALRLDSREAWLGLGLAVLFSVLAWGLALWLVQDQRAPRDESTAVYLDVAIRRSRAVVIGAPLGMGLYAAGVALTLGLRHVVLGQEVGPMLRSGPVVLALWIVTPLYTVVMGLYAIVHRRRLQRLHALRRALAGT
jgi:hypothetical protein